MNVHERTFINVHFLNVKNCAHPLDQNFGIFGSKKNMATMAFKHFTPNFERARTFTFVHVHILDVRERAPPATPTFGCARRNSKRPTNEKSLKRKRESTERCHEAAGHFGAGLECRNPYLNDKYPFFKSRVKSLLQTPGHVGFRKWVQSTLSTEAGCGAHFPWKVLPGCSTISK